MIAVMNALPLKTCEMDGRALKDSVLEEELGFFLQFLGW
jgi:hypothetical protein